MGDASEQETLMWVFELLFGLAFVGMIVYVAAGNYMVDKVVVAYRTMDMAFALSSGLAMSGPLVVKLPFTHNPDIKMQVEGDNLTLSLKLFAIVKLHDVMRKFDHNNKYEVTVRDPAMFFSKGKDVIIGDTKLASYHCPDVTITDKIVLIPLTPDDERMVKQILQEAPKIKAVSERNSPLIEKGVLNIYITEGDASIWYPHDVSFTSYACYFLQKEFTALPYKKEYITAYLDDSSYKKFAAALGGL